MLFFWNILHTREMNDTIHKSLYTTPLHTIQIIGSLGKIFFFFSIQQITMRIHQTVVAVMQIAATVQRLKPKRKRRNKQELNR